MKVTRTQVLKVLSKREWYAASYVAHKIESTDEMDKREQVRRTMQARIILRNLVAAGKAETTKMSFSHIHNVTVYRKL